MLPFGPATITLIHDQKKKLIFFQKNSINFEKKIQFILYYSLSCPGEVAKCEYQGDKQEGENTVKRTVLA